MKNLQEKIRQEEKRMALSRLNTLLNLNEFQNKEMENFESGIKSEDYDYEGSTRTERIENSELQKSKLRQNLIKLFGDDDQSMGITFNTLSNNIDDVKFFNMNFNKIYTDLSSIIDLEYLDSNYLISFFERYKLKYNDEKFGIDIFPEIDEEKEIVRQSPTQQVLNPTKDEELKNLILEYISMPHTADEYPDLLKFLNTLDINTNQMYNKNGSQKKTQAMAFLKKIFMILKQYFKGMSIKQKDKAILELNLRLDSPLNDENELDDYLKKVIYNLNTFIRDNNLSSNPNVIDDVYIEEKCKNKGYNFHGINDYSKKYPDDKDVFFDKRTNNLYLVKDLGNYNFEAQRINPVNLNPLKKEEKLYFYDDTAKFESEAYILFEEEEKQRKQQKRNLLQEMGQNKIILKKAPQPQQLKLKRNLLKEVGQNQVILKKAPQQQPQQQSGTGLKVKKVIKKNNLHKKNNKKMEEIEELLKILGYKIK